MGHLPARQRIFRKGWGDPDLLAANFAWAEHIPPVAAVSLEWGPVRAGDGLMTREITFTSPCEQLPDTMRLATARLLTADPEPERICLLMASWNDHDYRTRTGIARMLLERGIASVMLMQPFYGDRRVEPAEDQAIARVADFGLMGRAAVLEGRALAAALMEEGHRMGVSGYSMGGNIAAFVITSLPFPVAGAPLAAGASPAPSFLSGVLSGAIDWKALGGSDGEARERLTGYLEAIDVTRFPAPPHTAAAVLLAGTRDGYVPTAGPQAIHRHWEGSKMDWVNSGHAELLRKRTDRLVTAIVDSFDRLDAWGGRDPGN